MSSDVTKSTSFYGELFGWSSMGSGEEFGGYVTFLSEGLPVAGLMAKPAQADLPDAWGTYISTADLGPTIAAAVKLGATLINPAVTVGELGRWAILTDPVGAFFGLWQPGTHFGFAKYDEPGSVTWDEHHSRNFAVSTQFYADLFGWEMDKSADSDEFRYYQAQINGGTVAGLMDSAAMLPEGVPSYWAVYFSVADVDASVAKTVELGGVVMRPAEDTPFGRIADLADATGASFKVHGGMPSED
jgi:predicted enzyme related to lactoylglutathione lyase